MVKVFISHSSADKAFAVQLCADLRALDHAVWIDSNEICVGESIPRKIQNGLAEADYIIVVLSKAAIQSRWVEREWQPRFSDEVNEGRVIILPVLLQPCEIPKLLADRKYADFRRSYAVGIVELLRALDTFSTVDSKSSGVVSRQPSEPRIDDAINMLRMLGEETHTLSTIVPDALKFARSVGDGGLAEYCDVQLAGIGDRVYSLTDLPVWAESRAMRTYVSTVGNINPSYVGWGGSVNQIWEYIESHPQEFKWYRLVVPDPIHWIESQAAKSKPDLILHGTLRIGDIIDDAEDPDRRLPTYMRWDVYHDMCVRIRQDLVRMIAPYAK